MAREQLSNIKKYFSNCPLNFVQPLNIVIYTLEDLQAADKFKFVPSAYFVIVIIKHFP